MQKLLKRTQTSPFRSISSFSTIATTTLLSLSLGFSTPKTPLGSLLTFGKPQTMSAAVAPSGGSSLAAAGREAKTIRSPRFSLSTCRCASADIIPSGDSLRFLAATGALSWRGRYCTVGGMDGTGSGSVTAAAAAAAVEGLKGLEGEEDEGGEKGKRREKGSSEEKVGARLNRRQKGSSGDVEGNADLLTIPGVGPKNLRKLVDKGFRELAELKQFYKDKFLGKSNDTMVEYLQSSVGIIHRNHAESITNFIKESVDEELKESSSDVKPVPKNRLTFCVEGNISVGKTTFLQRIVSDTIELRDLVEVVPEPIDKWQDIGPDHFNILDAFYAEPHRYAYTFQNYVFVTRVMQERESSGGVKPLRLMERSVFSDRMVFVRAVHEAKWMNEMEISIYDSWFDPVVSVLPGLIPDGFIYLRASPDTCHKRLKLRKRAEEGGVSLDYLRDLHEKHESWLLPFQSGNHGVLSVSKPLLLDNSLHPDIRGKVFYLEGDHMHSSIQKVPALVLDCEANIDLNRDTEAKEHYARQVTEFFKYVKTIKDVSSAKGSDVGIGKRQILLPREGGLLLPNGQHFPESALKSLDFSQALSFMPGQ